MDKVLKTSYWISTILMCGIFLFSAFMYFTKYEMVTGFFEVLGFPIWLIYPLAVAKILGVAAVLFRKQRILKEWAYAGFFFDALLASAAHFYADHGIGLSVVAILLVLASRFFESQVYSIDA